MGCLRVPLYMTRWCTLDGDNRVSAKLFIRPNEFRFRIASCECTVREYTDIRRYMKKLALSLWVRKKIDSVSDSI
jgi:hypothetical protein